MMNIITVSEFIKIKSDPNSFLLDVRTKEEFHFSNIGGLNIPLDQIEKRISEIPKDKNIYCLCHHGVRSQHACMILEKNDFNDPTNISGGIDAWSNSIDPTVKRY